MNKERYVVGFLSGGVADTFPVELQIGMKQRADEEDVDLVVIPGKYLDRELSDDLKYEYQYNTLYKMVTEDNIDAVIMIADAIGCFTTSDRVETFIDYYSEIPSVLIASKVPGKSCICYDNYHGIKEAVEALIVDKKCTRFAMLGGPEVNSDALERKNSLMQVLDKAGLTFGPENFVEGDLTRSCHDAAAKLLDSNPDAEAIFCVNDDTAIALYEEMGKRGLVPGKDIYVLGYDNSELAGQVRPTLSSIWADPSELGRQAFDMALNLIRGRKTPSRNIDTMFVKRDSFGEDTAPRDITKLNKNQIKDIYNRIFYRLQGARGNVYKAFKEIIQDCIDILQADSYHPEYHEKLLAHFTKAIDEDMLEYADIEMLQNYIEKIYAHISDGEAVRKDRQEVKEGINYIYRLLIAGQERRIRKIIDVDKAIDFSLKLVAQDIMQFENGNDQNYAIPLRKLPLMGIHNAALYLLDEPVVHLDGEDWKTPEYVNLKAVLVDDEMTYITLTNQKTSIKDIFRCSFLADKRLDMVLLPLFSNEIMYGYLLTECSEHLNENGEILVNQLSAAVKMLNTLKVNEEIKLQLEQSLVTLRDNNIRLDNLSKVDAMTGILNRRGFYEAAEACLTVSYETGIPIMVMYCDMDNLKIVNDRYGHDEGDFSLKFITEVFGEMVGDHGAIGRIGGDEFAGIAWADIEPDEFKSRMRAKFDEFNKSSDKLFNISASVGIYRIPDDIHMDLEEALARADEDLYDEKKKRTKKTAKN